MNIITKSYLADDEQVKKWIKEAVVKVAKIVGVTYGPNGQSVLISQKVAGVDNVVFTKDGATVLKTLAYANSIERAISKLMIDAGAKVLQQEGDGTTTVTLLTKELYLTISQVLENTNINPQSFRNELMAAAWDICQRIDSLSRPVTEEQQLIQVATISANGDEEIGREVGKLSFSLGKNGTIFTEISRTVGIIGEKKNGYVAGINNKEQIVNSVFLGNKNKIELDSPAILLIDDTMQSIDDFKSFLDFCQQSHNAPSFLAGNVLVICRGVMGTFLQTLTNAFQSGGRAGKLIAIKMPYDMMSNDWKDLSKVVDAPMIFANTNIPITKFSDYAAKEKKYNWLQLVGKAKKVTLYKDKFVVEPQSQQLIENTIQELDELRKSNNNQNEYDEISSRIAKLSSGIGVLHVGSTTDSEQGRKFAAIDDAQRACFSAWRGGVVQGGLSTMLVACNKSGSELFFDAVKSLYNLLYKNIGRKELYLLEEPIVLHPITGQVIDGWAAGIIEPANVLKTCINVAVIQAWELANCGAINDITEI